MTISLSLTVSLDLTISLNLTISEALKNWHFLLLPLVLKNKNGSGEAFTSEKIEHCPRREKGILTMCIFLGRKRS